MPTDRAPFPPTQALLAFSLPPAAAAAHIAALHRLRAADPAAAAAPSGTARKRAAPGARSYNSISWTSQLLTAADALLSRHMERRNATTAIPIPTATAIAPHNDIPTSSAGAGAPPAATASVGLRRVCAALFAVGEVALLGVRPPQALVIKVQSLTAAGASSAATDTHTAAAAAAMGVGSGGCMSVGATQSQSQSLLPPLPTQLAEGVASGSGGGSELQGGAWLCLGKLCVMDEALAKKAVPLFVQVRFSGWVLRQ